MTKPREGPSGNRRVDFHYTKEEFMAVEVDVVRAVEVPTRLVHGPGAIGHLRDVVAELGVTRPLLVSDPGVAAAGLVDRALEHVDNAVVFPEVRPNPDIALVDRG